MTLYSNDNQRLNFVLRIFDTQLEARYNLVHFETVV